MRARGKSGPTRIGPALIAPLKRNRVPRDNNPNDTKAPALLNAGFKRIA